MIDRFEAWEACDAFLNWARSQPNLTIGALADRCDSWVFWCAESFAVHGDAGNAEKFCAATDCPRFAYGWCSNEFAHRGDAENRQLFDALADAEEQE